MRTFSLLLACALALISPSMAGHADDNLPGVGTFTYSGSQITVAPPSIVIAPR